MKRKMAVRASACEGKRAAPALARLVTAALPSNGFLATYLDAQNGVVAVVPNAEADIAHLATLIPAHLGALGARYVVLGANPAFAKRLVDAVNADRTAAPLPSSYYGDEYRGAADPSPWSRQVRDVMGLTTDPAIYTSHRDDRLRESSETHLGVLSAHSVFEEPTPYAKDDVPLPDATEGRSESALPRTVDADTVRGTTRHALGLAGDGGRTTPLRAGQTDRVAESPTQYDALPPDVRPHPVEADSGRVDSMRSKLCLGVATISSPIIGECEARSCLTASSASKRPPA